MADSLGSALDLMFSFTSSMALKAVIQLGVLDILHRAAPQASLTAHEIAAQLPSTHPNVHFLSRLLRFLASSSFLSFSCTTSDSGEMQYRYGLTDVATWFLRENNAESLAAFALFDLDEPFMRPFHHIPQCVLDGGEPFTVCHGQDQWTFLSNNAALREEFNLGTDSMTTTAMRRVLTFYDGFKDVHTLVDVGGATGKALSLIISAYPHIHAINFDLPHVVAAVPKLPGIQYVGGSMLESVPSGDAIQLKSLLHDWDDEDCRKVLGNCLKATPPEGRLIIIDSVIDDTNIHDPVQRRKLAHDMVMLAHRGMGTERTELQWRNLLSSAGFPRAQIYGMHERTNVIEAFKS